MTLEELERRTEGMEFIPTKDAAEYLEMGPQTLIAAIRSGHYEHVGARVRSEHRVEIPRNRFIAYYRYTGVGITPTEKTLMKALIAEMDARQEFCEILKSFLDKEEGERVAAI